jgi:hypothetical protein
MENTKKYLIAAIVTTTLVGTGIGASMNLIGSNAQNITTAEVQPIQTAPEQNNQKSPKVGGHVGANGVREEPLTGDTAEKVREAALKAVPGSTINIVETDAEGSPYEAHITKPDGTRATLKFDNNFNVTSNEDGMK